MGLGSSVLGPLPWLLPVARYTWTRNLQLIPVSFDGEPLQCRRHISPSIRRAQFRAQHSVRIVDLTCTAPHVSLFHQLESPGITQSLEKSSASAPVSHMSDAAVRDVWVESPTHSGGQAGTLGARFHLKLNELCEPLTAMEPRPHGPLLPQLSLDSLPPEPVYFSLYYPFYSG